MSTKSRPFWIGLTDARNEGNFSWESDLKLSPFIEKYWGPNRGKGTSPPPNTMVPGKKVCVRVNIRGKMYVVDCEGTTTDVVCQKDLRGMWHQIVLTYVQRFRVKCGLLGSVAGKDRPLDLGRMFANHAKTV